MFSSLSIRKFKKEKTDLSCDSNPREIKRESLNFVNSEKVDPTPEAFRQQRLCLRM